MTLLTHLIIYHVYDLNC